MNQQRRVAPDQYDGLAREYVATVEPSPVNSLIERPLVLDLLGEVRGARILDAGCGAGRLSLALAGRGARVVGLDASAEMLARANECIETNVELVRHDLNMPLPFADESFDAVAASLVLHYVEDWKSVLSEFGRVLRPGSVLVITTHHPLRDTGLGSSGYLATEAVSERWSLDGKTVEVSFWRRPLEQMFSAFAAGGFAVERLIEPPSGPGATDARLLCVQLRSAPWSSADPGRDTAAMAEPPHIAPGQTLCLELHVPAPAAAAAWLGRWGFEVLRATPAFMVVARDGQLVLLGRRPMRRPATSSGTIGELRVLVDDIDVWRQVATDDEIVVELHDASYGLREFVVESPFGLDVRLATPCRR